jgi:dTDP-4-dehydrorhamnose 3,5-epimerase
MIKKETKLKGCFVFESKIFKDNRGYFFESFNQELFNQAVGEKVDFVQDNQSFSTKGVLRGLHYQKGEHSQAKLVRVISGIVLDVAVDLRKKSKTYGQYISVELSENNRKQLFIPRGFAHGFIVLSNTAILSYKCDNFYNKDSEGGIYFNDNDLNIDWVLSKERILVSEKDIILPSFKSIQL